MRYNDNNRVTPDEIIDIRLNPAASPTNQETKYQPDLTQAKQSAATAESLAKLGQGVLDTDYILSRKAQESIIEAENKTIAEGGNQKEWADVSKNVRGMAKFNPYMKDAFEIYTAQDIYRAATLKIQSNPNVVSGKMSAKEYHKFTTDTRNEMMSAFKESGLKPNNYSRYVEKLHSDIFKVDNDFITKNAEYTYNNTLTAMAHDTALRMGANVSVAKTEETKLEGLNLALKDTIEQAQAIGVPSDEIITKVLSVGLSDFLVNNADKFNSATLITALGELKIDGKSLGEIIPNFDYQLQETIKKVKRASYSDRLLEYENNQLTLKIDTENATKDFFSWYKQNQNAAPEEIQAQALGLINQYDIDAEGVAFLGSVANTRGLMVKLKENITDPITFNSLTAKAATGLLENQEIADAVLDGVLNPKDAFNLQGKMEAVERQGATEFGQKSKRVLERYTTKKGADYRETPPDVRDSINSAVAQIRAKLDNGEYTSSQADAKLQQLQKAIPNMILDKHIQNKNHNIILNGTYRNTQNIPTPNRKKAEQAIVKMGLLRNEQNTRDTTITIDSMQSNNRNGRKHLGNDIGGIWLGRPVYPPSDGTVVSTGHENTMGNYAVFEDRRGKYILFMHLKSGVNRGSIKRNTILGYVGNTGSVKDKSVGSLHTECWNENLQVVRPEEW